MTSIPNQPEGKITEPSSKAITIFKYLFYGAVFVWVIWIIYNSYQFIENDGRIIDEHEPMGPEEDFSTYDERTRGWGWPLLYYLFQPTLVGLVTYVAVTIDLKLICKHFFTKYKLVPAFVSFGITAPLVSLPFAIFIVLGAMESGHMSRDLGMLIFYLASLGQLYWFLLPIQAAITIFGKNCLLMGLGYIVIVISNIVSILLFFLTLYMAALGERTNAF